MLLPACLEVKYFSICQTIECHIGTQEQGSFEIAFSFISNSIRDSFEMSVTYDKTTPEGAVTFQSKDHGQLLDIIDQLRAFGVDSHVPLPQLIVCGDQSSGKSSVLEAISGVRFPVKDGLCTRFATEVILRRDSQESSKVYIMPAESRSDEEKGRLQKFKASAALGDAFTSMVERAKDTMGLSTDARTFSEDVLKVEINGPKQPHLTLVDLPGVFHAGPDSIFVKDLVLGYMKRRRSIILAVVSARSDRELQLVTEMTESVDPKGLRTLGVITKPDEIKGAANAFLNLAKNKDIVYRLGWHVLKNRDHAEQNCSTEERDRAEKDFFSRGVWTTLPADSVGIDALKPRLSAVLKTHILRELPDLIDEVESGIRDCKAILSKLGMARVTSQDQRLHLIRACERFTSLLKEARDGTYLDPFFGPIETDEGCAKRLRAVFQNGMLDFAELINTRGHRFEIVDSNTILESDDKDDGYPEKIKESDFTENVRELLRKSRGRELPGTFNPLIIGDLFYQQSKPWESLVHKHCQDMLGATRRCLRLVLASATDEKTQDGLLLKIIEPSMETMTSELDKKICEVMKPHTQGHPITYNHYFIENCQKGRQDLDRQDLKTRVRAFFDNPKRDQVERVFSITSLVESLARSTEADMDEYSCAEAMHCMRAYYKVAMKTVVDSVATLALENVILSRLTSMFTSEVVLDLDEEIVADIAGETKESQQERMRAVTKLSSLEQGLKALQQLRLHGEKDFEGDQDTNLSSDEAEKEDTREDEEHDSKIDPESSLAASANGSPTIVRPMTPHEVPSAFSSEGKGPSEVPSIISWDSFDTFSAGPKKVKGKKKSSGVWEE